MLPFDQWVGVRAYEGPEDKRVFFTGTTGYQLVMTDLEGNLIDTQPDPGGGVADYSVSAFNTAGGRNPQFLTQSMWGRYFVKDVAKGRVYYVSSVGVYPITVSADGMSFSVGDKLFGYSGSELPSGQVSWISGGRIVSMPNVYDGVFRSSYYRGLSTSFISNGIVFKEADAGSEIMFGHGIVLPDYPGLWNGSYLNHVLPSRTNRDFPFGYYGVSGGLGWRIFNWWGWDGLIALQSMRMIAGNQFYNFPENTCSFGVITSGTASSRNWRWLLLTWGDSRTNPTLGLQELTPTGLSEVKVIVGELPDAAGGYTPSHAVYDFAPFPGEADRPTVTVWVGYGTLAVIDAPVGATGSGLDLRVREVDRQLVGRRTIYDRNGEPISVSEAEELSTILIDDPPDRLWQDADLSFEYLGTRYNLQDISKDQSEDKLWEAVFRRSL